MNFANVKIRTLSWSARREDGFVGAATRMLMALHGITEEQALDLLHLASRLRHRGLNDLAHDVLDAGCLDPAIVPRRR